MFATFCNILLLFTSFYNFLHLFTSFCYYWNLFSTLSSFFNFLLYFLALFCIHLQLFAIYFARASIFYIACAARQSLTAVLESAASSSCYYTDPYFNLNLNLKPKFWLGLVLYLTSNYYTL